MIVLQTNDTPAEVLEFYKSRLVSDGWRFDTITDGLHFYWVEGCPVYGLDVITTQSTDGVTVIELELTKEFCM